MARLLPAAAHSLSHHRLSHLSLLLAVLPLALALLLLPPRAAGADTFRIEILESQVQTVPLDETTDWTFQLTHLGQISAGYTCRAYGDLPADWFTSLCSESECTYDSVDVELGPGEHEIISMYISPFGVPGSGTMELRIRSHDPPGEVQSRFIGAVSGVTQLVVDDDSGSDYESYVVAAFAANGTTAGVWPVWIDEPVASDLVGYASVYWLTGDDATTTIAEKERAELYAYLDGGGRLLVAGQGIGADIGETPFYTYRLGATFTNNNAASAQVVGMAGDPISDGMSFTIEGGTGAGNQSSPDAIQAIGTPLFHYANGLGAGVRVEGGGVYRTVYLPFGPEGVAEAGDRALLIDRIRTWLEATPEVGVGEASAPARDGILAAAVPNPSPGRTRIAITARGASEITGLTSAQVILSDAAGRIVARLRTEPAGPGRFIADWDGLTAAGATARRGIYFYCIESNARRIAHGQLVITR